MFVQAQIRQRQIIVKIVRALVQDRQAVDIGHKPVPVDRRDLQRLRLRRGRRRGVRRLDRRLLRHVDQRRFLRRTGAQKRQRRNYDRKSFHSPLASPSG